MVLGTVRLVVSFMPFSFSCRYDHVHDRRVTVINQFLVLFGIA